MGGDRGGDYVVKFILRAGYFFAHVLGPNFKENSWNFMYSQCEKLCLHGRNLALRLTHSILQLKYLVQYFSIRRLYTIPRFLVPLLTNQDLWPLWDRILTWKWMELCCSFG